MKKQIFILLICFPAMVFAQWSNDPAINTKICDTIGEQAQPKVIVDLAGESYISWFSDLGGLQFDVYMQRLDINGNRLWDEEGLLISEHATNSWTTDYAFILDKTGNAVLITQDIRDENSNVYAYSISPEGEFLWGNDGIALTNDDDFDPSPSAVVDQQGNIIIMWEAVPIDSNMFTRTSFQKLSPNGDLLWNNVVIENDSANCWMPQMILTEDTCIVVVWVETEKPDSTGPVGVSFMHAFAQKIDSYGNFVWSEKAYIDTLNNMPLFPFSPSLGTDGNGGLYVSWMAFPNSFNYTCYAQYINSNGIVQWTPNGVNVSDSTQFQHTEPILVTLPQEEGMFVFWNELRPRSVVDLECAVFGQKFSFDGQRQWSTQGKLIDGWFNGLDTSVAIFDARVIETDIAMFFEHEYLDRSPTDTLIRTDYFATRVDTDGNYVWNNNKVIFSNSSSWKLQLNISEVSQNQWIAVWEDNRNDPQHGYKTGIYGQNIGVDGTIGPVSVPENPAISNFDVVVSPNPANSFVKIEYTLSSGGLVIIDLLDINGKLRTQYNEGDKASGTHSTQLNISDLCPGLYLISVKSNGLISNHKLMVN